MNKHHYLDDSVLWTIWQEEEDITWQTAYKVYRIPFVRFFQQVSDNTLSVAACLEIYPQAFTMLNTKILNGGIRLPLQTYLFFQLLNFGKKHFDTSISNAKFGEALEKANRYLAGDILLELGIHLEAEELIKAFDENYKNIACNIINSRWNFKNQEAEDSYSESMLIFWKKIKKSKIPSPLFGMLFKYFLTIFWRKTRDDRNKWNHKDYDVLLISPNDLKEWNKILPDKASGEREYLEYLLDTVLKGYDFKSNRDLVLKLIEWANEPLKTILYLRYIEHEKLTDIAEHLGLTPVHVRQILFKGLADFRDIFFK